MSKDFVDIAPNSQFRFTPVYRDADFIRFGLRQTPVYPSSADRTYVVPAHQENRLDLISNAFYGTPELWWVIADANNMSDPMTATPAGTQLRIPPNPVS